MGKYTGHHGQVTLGVAGSHLEKFGDMFTTEAREERVYALKPMNCPGVFKFISKDQKL